MTVKTALQYRLFQVNSKLNSAFTGSSRILSLPTVTIVKIALRLNLIVTKKWYHYY